MNVPTMIETLVNLNLLLQAARKLDAPAAEQALYFLGGATVLLEPFKIEAVVLAKKQNANLN